MSFGDQTLVQSQVFLLLDREGIMQMRGSTADTCTCDSLGDFPGNETTGGLSIERVDERPSHPSLAPVVVSRWPTVVPIIHELFGGSYIEGLSSLILPLCVLARP